MKKDYEIKSKRSNHDREDSIPGKKSPEGLLMQVTKKCVAVGMCMTAT